MFASCRRIISTQLAPQLLWICVCVCVCRNSIVVEWLRVGTIPGVAAYCTRHNPGQPLCITATTTATHLHERKHARLQTKVCARPLCGSSILRQQLSLSLYRSIGDLGGSLAHAIRLFVVVSVDRPPLQVPSVLSSEADNISAV